MAPDAVRIAYQACPLCEGGDIPPYARGDCSNHPLYDPALPKIMTWLKCRGCGHVFTDGWLTDAACAIVFSRTNESQKIGWQIEPQRLVSARMVAKVARHVADGAWLDVGFGNGSLIFTADEFGYEAVGVDLRRDNVDGLKALGYEAYDMSLEKLDQPGRFSVISMADVLEHMPFPKAGLEDARRLLRPGGLLFLSMPNLDSELWRFLDRTRSNPFWGELEHYHNFGRKRLTALLAEHGFRAIEYGISERYRACMELIALKQA
jgi:2-polyprenyl-3-methyl-5-hydroxy-6-metoxy-1,4-benzoquinol methylase